MSQQMPPQGPYGQPVPSQGVQGGPLPQRAQARLNSMRGDARHRGLSTSDLSINEFVLTREAGFEPLGLVMGSSIYHVGWQAMKWNSSQEVTILTQAMFNARELAMERMQAEATALQATNIVGVSFSQDNYEWESHVIEFFTLGTAVIPMATDHALPTPSLTLPLNG